MAIRNIALTLAFISLHSAQLSAQTSQTTTTTTPAATTPAATPAAATATATASTPPAIPAAPTACSAAFGIFGPLNGGGGGGNSTPATQATATVTNTTAAPTTPTPSTKGDTSPAPTLPGPTPANGLTGVLDLRNPVRVAAGNIQLEPHPFLTASAVVTALQGRIPGVTSLAAVGTADLLYTIDPSKAAPVAGQTPAQTILAQLITTLNSFPRYAKGEAPVASKSKSTPLGLTGIFDLSRAPGGEITLNASDVAVALQGKIPGVTTLVALGPNALLYTIDPSKAATAPPVTSTQGLAQAERIEEELRTALDRLPREEVIPDVLNLPDGFQGACAIITMVGHQIRGIVSLAALSDTRILVGYLKPKKPEEEDPLPRLKSLVKKLAVSNSPPAPAVQSVTMRLYYDRDAVSVASVVQSAFSQLKVQSVSMNPTFTYRDTIVIADPTGTNSMKALDQARRMVAVLDQPRAQVVVNAWSLQISRNRKDTGNELVPVARRLAGGYNDALEAAVLRGWQYVNKWDPSDPSLAYDPFFTGYLCNRFIFGGDADADLVSRLRPSNTSGCPNDLTDLHYSLGYSTLFGQENPDLIQMMILVMATRNPHETIEKTLNAMEGRSLPRVEKLNPGDGYFPGDATPPPASPGDCCSCQQRDQQFYRLQTEYFKKHCYQACNLNEQPGEGFYNHAVAQVAPRFVSFSCTRDKLTALTRSDGSKYTSSFVGQFRAAVADYLFQNKMQSEYPNDFDPFLYPASAATLDAALTPIVEAFDQDLQALQQNLQEQLTYNVPQDKHLTYTSNGLISVKVVSGNQALAQTQSLNYFPQNPTLSLENFAKSLAAVQNPAPAGSSGTVPVAPTLLAGSLSSVITTMGAYAASLPQQVTAKVGSGLSLTVTPFTLSSAKGAELQVNVTYNENAAATLSSDTTQANSSDDLNSRVSEHEVNTLVRMDSLKFFEISTMQSVIARARKPWKPFDPFFELPLLDNPGSFGWPRKPDVIYNQSIIFLEASIMPTAADLGQGLLYRSDRIETNACGSDKGPTSPKAARSSSDFCFDENSAQSPLEAIIQYHKQMIQYFGSQYINADGFITAAESKPGIKDE